MSSQVSSLHHSSLFSDDIDSVPSTSSGSTVSAENQEDEHQSIRIQDTIAQRMLNILSGCHLAEKNEKQNLIISILCEAPNLNFMGESLDRVATTFFNIYGQLSDSQLKRKLNGSICAQLIISLEKELHASIDEEKTRRTSGRIGNRISSKANVKSILDLVEKARKKAALDIELEKAKSIKLLETRLGTNPNPRRLRIQDQKPFVAANRDPMECPYCQHLSVMITSVPEEIERENERQKVCHERKVSFLFLFLLYSIHAY